MKNPKLKPGEYVSPFSTILYVCFEGALCTSDDDGESTSGSFEGFGGEDPFTGWGN